MLENNNIRFLKCFMSQSLQQNDNYNIVVVENMLMHPIHNSRFLHHFARYCHECLSVALYATAM